MAERSIEALYRRRKSLSATSIPPSMPSARRTLNAWSGTHAPGFQTQSPSPFPSQGGVKKSHSEELVRTIEGEVIPRLMLALGVTQQHVFEASPNFVPSHGHVAELVRHCLSTDEQASELYVKHLHDRGMTLDSIYLLLVTPVARRLGEMWTDDTADFTQVTVGLARLHAIIRRLGPAFRATYSKREFTTSGNSESRNALILPAASEQHTLGCVIVEDFFVRDGWQVSGWPLTADSDLVNCVRNDYIDLVGLSVSCESNLPALAQQIAATRRASRNKSLIIMVGGRVFTENPQLAGSVGADTTGANGHDAVAAANAAVNRRADRI